jgi:hypothetical protein
MVRPEQKLAGVGRDVQGIQAASEIELYEVFFATTGFTH